MSLLVCTICEQNRIPLTETVDNVQKTLGKTAIGKFNSTNKFVPFVDSSFSLAVIFDDDSVQGIHYTVAIQKNGDYEITAPDYFLHAESYAHFNHLYIMNKVVEYIEKCFHSQR